MSFEKIGKLVTATYSRLVYERHSSIAYRMRNRGAREQANPRPWRTTGSFSRRAAGLETARALSVIMGGYLDRRVLRQLGLTRQ
jgi:hypothetical protein